MLYFLIPDSPGTHSGEWVMKGCAAGAPPGLTTCLQCDITDLEAGGLSKCQQIRSPESAASQVPPSLVPPSEQAGQLHTKVSETQPPGPHPYCGLRASQRQALVGPRSCPETESPLGPPQKEEGGWPQRESLVHPAMGN